MTATAAVAATAARVVAAGATGLVAAAVDAVRVDLGAADAVAVDAGPAVQVAHAVAVAVDVVLVDPAADAGRVGLGHPAVAPPEEVGADAVSQACQAPQAAPRPSSRQFAWPAARAVRRLRPEGARVRLVDQPPDRGSPYCHDAQDQAWRQGMDQRVPR